MLKLIQIKLNFNFYSFISFFLLLIITFNIFNLYNTIPGDGWAYNELFVNYSEGFIRRGLLGEIFQISYTHLGIDPKKIFIVFLSIIHFLNTIIFLNLLKQYQDSKLFILLIAFSPALLLFPIYDINVFLAKDVFTNFAILLHAFVACKTIRNKNNLRLYGRLLKYLIIPILFFNLLNHENQFFFLTVHFLIALLVYEVKNFNGLKILFPFAILLIPIVLVINFSQLSELSLINLNENLYNNYGVKVNSEISGNINLKIGGFLKQHFAYNSIDNFLNFFFCFLLSVFFIFIIFQYFLEKKIINFNSYLKKYYLLFFLPCLGLFIQIDHGRTLNVFSFHLISLFFCLKINNFELKKIFIFNLLQKSIASILIFIYVFLWFMPQGGGYHGIGNFTEKCSIKKNTLLLEVSRIFIFTYDFIDDNFIKLPYVIDPNFKGKFDKSKPC